ncbi:MAG TPA: MFS transporter [Solirubrobacteraceae bacterium]|nr:MFS transporter [Solirubrobacteraceae bacterium]
MTRPGDAFSWRFTTPLYLGSALNPVNSALIATALVPIARAMHVSVGRTSVLVAALYLASAIAQPTMGKLSEEFGPRRIFITGILLVLTGGVVGGLADNLTTLIVARALIGIGTSAGYPSAMLLIRRRATTAGLAAPPGGVLGGLSIAGQATAALGLPLGGVLVAAAGWRSTFLINVPVAGLALLVALAWIPRDPAIVSSRARELLARIDALGIVGFAGAMTALLVFLLGLPGVRWAALALSVAIGALLVWWELRAATPFFDVRLLVSNVPLTMTYLRQGMALLATYTVLYGITQWIEAGRGLSAEQAGLLILPMTVVGAVLSAVVSRRNLIRGPLIAAALASMIAALLLLLLTAHTPVILIVGVTIVFGITVGASVVGNQTALYAQAPAEQVATAAGLLRTFGYIGAIVSSTITNIVFRTNVSDHGLHVIGATLVVVSAVLLVMTLADRRLRSPTFSAAPNPRLRLEAR